MKGKNRRFNISLAVMAALILTPFGLYAALNQGNAILSGLFFTVIVGSMILILIYS